MTGGGDPLLESAGLSAAQLDELLALLAATDITELDLTLGSTRLSLRRSPSPASASPALLPETRAVVAHDLASVAIASPLVGIFRPSVSPGDALEPGQSIGAIEALGMPTSVDAPDGGTVEELLVASGAPVEYGQPLVLMRRSKGAQPLSTSGGTGFAP